MIILPDPTHEKRVIDAIQAANSGDSYDVRLSLMADAGGGRGLEDLSELWEKGEWGQTDLPITLDATIAGYLPTRFLDAQTRVVAEVDGCLIEQMTGRKTALDTPMDPYSTELLSSSAGSLATGPDAIKLRAFTEYPGWEPDQVVIDAAARLPYRQSRVLAQKIPGVHVNFAGSGEHPGFVSGEAVGGIFSRLGQSQTVGYVFHDTNYGGMRALVPNPISSTDARNPKGGYRSYESGQMPGWDLERPVPPKERYSEVRVFRNDRNGKLLFEEFAEIYYPPWLRRPHKNRFLDIPFEDTTDNGRDGARIRAVREAQRQSRLLLQGPELTLPAFDPLIESEDPIWVQDVFRNYDGLYEASWRMDVKAYKHDFGNGASRASAGSGGVQVGSLNTICAYEASNLYMGKVRAPDLIVPTAAYASMGAASAPPDATYDFTGANGAAWPSPWVNVFGTHTIQSNRGRMQKAAVQWDIATVRLSSSRQNFQFSGEIIRNATYTHWPALEFRKTGNNYHRFEMTPNFTTGNVRFKKWVNGVDQGATAGTQTNFTFPVNTPVSFKVRVEGSAFKYKLWPSTDPEPAAWAVEITEASVPGDGEMNLFMIDAELPGQATYVDWDNLKIWTL